MVQTAEDRGGNDWGTAVRPVMLVVAGPPGSGKRTFFPIAAMGVDAFSIDDRCAQIVGSYRAIPPDVRRAVSQQCELRSRAHRREPKLRRYGR
jgi:hypothetical protein